MAFNYIGRETRLTVAHEEKAPSPVIRDDENSGFSATRRLLCDYKDRLKFIRELRGSIAPGPILTVRVIPHRFPEFRDALCLEASAEPFGALSSAEGVIPPSYIKALVTAVYRVPDGFNFPSPNEEPPTVLITESLEPSADFVTFPSGGLFFKISQSNHPFESDKVPDDVNVGKLFVTLDWVYTQHQSFTVPDEAFDLIGKVNKDPVTSRRLDRTFEAESLLFTSMHAEREITTDGPQAWRITFRFTYKQLLTDDPDPLITPKTGWNLFPIRGDLPPQPIFDSGAIRVKPYEQADFGKIVT